MTRFSPFSTLVAGAVMLFVLCSVMSAQVPDTIRTSDDAYTYVGALTTAQGVADSTLLRVRQTSSGTATRNSYIKFNLTTYSKNIAVAKIRLGVERVASVTNSRDRLDVYSISDNNWTTATLTYSNAPAKGSYLVSQLFSQIQSSAPDTFFTFDVSNYVKTQFATNKVMSFMFTDDSGATNGSTGSDCRFISSRNVLRPKYYPALLIWNTATAVEEEVSAVPQSFDLKQNFPNPFNPATQIAYELPTSGHVEASVFNILGERVQTLASGVQAAGYHQVTWDGRTRSGQPLPSGLYLCTFNFGGMSKTIKMLLVR